MESNLDFVKELRWVIQMSPLIFLIMAFLRVHKWKLYLALMQVMDLDCCMGKILAGFLVFQLVIFFYSQ